MKDRPALRLPALLLLLLLLLSACAQDRSITYQRAIDSFSDGEYDTAAQAFEKLGDFAQAPQYAAYSRGLVLYEQGFYVQAMPYFENTQELFTGAARYAYCRAFSLEEAGSFAEAAEAFELLQDFEDASLHAAYCRAREAENNNDYVTALFLYESAGNCSDAADRLDSLRNQIYVYAIELKNQKQYADALDFFTLLGSYLSSPAYARECKDYFREEDYNQAEALEQEGRLQEAYEAFRAISSYRDAEVRVQILAQRLGISYETEEEENFE